jgi:hypothetical protein
MKKNDRRDRSARYQLDKNLMVNHIDDSDLGHGTFDEELEPQPADFHGSPIRGRNQSEDYSPNDVE